MKRLLHTEDIGGRTEYWWLHVGNDGKEAITVQTVEDTEATIDQNKREYASAPAKFGKGTFHKVAVIPATVIEEVCRIKQIQFRELMANKTDKAQHIWKHLLNAPELRSFRTRPGRVDLSKR